MLLPLGKVKAELDLGIVFIVESLDISKGTALLPKGQFIYPGEIQVFAQNVKKEHIGPITVTLRLIVKEIPSPCQEMGEGASPRPPKCKCMGP